MNCNKAEVQLDNVMRLSQVDLSSLDRDRLEALCMGLLEGHVSILQTIVQETRATAFVKEVSRQNEELLETLSRMQRLVYLFGDPDSFDAAVDAIRDAASSGVSSAVQWCDHNGVEYEKAKPKTIQTNIDLEEEI